MSDERMSRRARRAHEEELEAAAESGVFAAAQQADDAESTDSDEVTLSRRDRRRLERVASPVEAWTAEEEMLATGQIPRLTPEVIAEQERLAREKAAQMQAEATAASSEIRRVSMHDVDPARAAAVTGAVVAAPEAVAPASEPVEPEPVAPASEPVEPEPEAVAPAPEPEPEPEPEVAAAAPVAAPASAPTPTLQNLFPPGSLQARAFAEQLAKSQAEAEGGQVEPAQSNASVHGEGVPPASSAPDDSGDDAAEEIRRLTAAAMANIQRTAVVEPQPESQASPAEAAAAWAEQVAPSSGSFAVPGLSAAEPWEAPAGSGPIPRLDEDPEPTREPQSGAVPAPTPNSGSFPTLPAQTGAIASLAPATGGFAALYAPQSGSIATGGISAIPPVAPQSPSAQTAPSPWQAHPLDSAPPSQPDMNIDAAPQNVPPPDFSALIAPTAVTFSPNGMQSTGNVNPFAPEALRTATGGIPRVPSGDESTTVQRRAADLQPAGGARHFRGAHYAVLAALMFVLGVVVIQVWKLNS